MSEENRSHVYTDSSLFSKNRFTSGNENSIVVDKTYMNDIYYDTSKKGLAIIIDNFKYFASDSKFKIGIETKDETENLKNVLESLNFTVSVHEQQKEGEIKEILKRAENRNDISCLIVVNISRCTWQTKLLDITDKLFDPTHLSKDFIGKLYNIPKIFLIQGVKEIQYLKGVDESDGKEVESKEKVLTVLPQTSDFLFLNSLSEDTYVAREAQSCWFLSNLCKVFKQYGDRYHILDLMTMVNAEIRKEYAIKQKEDWDFETQMPTLKSSLTKLLQFKSIHTQMNTTTTNLKI